MIRAVTAAKPRHADAGEHAVRHVRNIDIEKHGIGGLLLIQKLFYHSLSDFRGRLKFHPAAVNLRKSDRIDAELVAFDRRCDGARIHCVVAHVGAGIDPGHHEVRTVVQNPGEGEVHAVRRGAAHRVDIPRHLGHPERQLKREGVARSRLVMLGRADRHAAELRHRFRKRLNAAGGVAVVV